MAYMAIPNIAYSLFLGQFSPTRAIINIDYLALGALSLMLPIWLIVTAFVILSIFDAFAFISTLYHFTPYELLMSASYARYSPIKLRDLPLLNIAMTALAIAGAIVLACKVRASGSKRAPLILAVLLVAVMIADIASGSNTYGPFTRLPFYTRIQRVAVNPANSGVMAVDPGAFVPIARVPVMAKAESASQIALRQWRGLPKRGTAGTNIGLVLVESWGQIDGQERLTRALAAPLLTPEIAARYDVRIGSVGFRGSTTGAELRELCGLQGDYHDLFNLPRFRCLPDIFRDIGYTTIGMHGFHGDMFDRSSWWPYLGIQQGLFLKDFRRAGYGRTCGNAFLGLCDADLVTAMGDRLTSPRRFVYALTVNSHLPLARVDDADGAFRCSALPIPLEDVPCALAQNWHRTFTSVARNALRNDIRPTQFIVVGDHSPPLLGTSNHRFSPTQVPYILLTPRAIMRASLAGRRP